MTISHQHLKNTVQYHLSNLSIKIKLVGTLELESNSQNLCYFKFTI
jgi:hypothetical protein